MSCFDEQKKRFNGELKASLGREGRPALKSRSGRRPTGMNDVAVTHTNVSSIARSSATRNPMISP